MEPAAPPRPAPARGHAAGPTDEILLQRREPRQALRDQGRPARLSTSAPSAPSTASASTSARGETLGLVGESGCGKTTLGKVILRLLPATSGKVTFEGRVLFDVPTAAEKRKAGKKTISLDADEMKKVRRDMQVVFQDPYASLNPRMSVGEIVGEGPLVHGLTDKKKREALVRELLGKVGLNQSHIHRYPHEFSGGQRQRIGIARALALNPDFIVCDEPVSALDVSIQSQVLNLLDDLQNELGLTYLFIAHNLAVVEHISDRVGVMYLGKMVELADVDELYAQPAPPVHASRSCRPSRTRTRASARRARDPQGRHPVAGEPAVRLPLPHPLLAPRAPRAAPECSEIVPELREIVPGHQVACHFAEKVTPKRSAPPRARAKPRPGQANPRPDAAARPVRAPRPSGVDSGRGAHPHRPRPGRPAPRPPRGQSRAPCRAHPRSAGGRRRPGRLSRARADRAISSRTSPPRSRCGPDDPRLAALAAETLDLSVVVSYVEESADHRLFIAAALIEDGQVRHVHRKIHLPTYGLFDERRFFAPGDSLRAVPSRLGVGIGLAICEDFWHLETAQVLALDGAQILVNVVVLARAATWRPRTPRGWARRRAGGPSSRRMPS